MTPNRGLVRPEPRSPQRIGRQQAMQTEFYRIVYWVGMAALVVWTVYSAYSALILS